MGTYGVTSKLHMPSCSSYHGVSVPGEVVIISEALTSTTSISGFIYFFILVYLLYYLPITWSLYAAADPTYAANASASAFSFSPAPFTKLEI